MEKPAVILYLKQYFNAKIVIDASSFSYEGAIKGYTNARGDSFISFRLIDSSVEKAKKAVESLRNQFELNVDKEEYIKLRTKFEDYETDKRPKITIRLYSGLAGMANPSTFSLIPVTNI